MTTNDWVLVFLLFAWAPWIIVGNARSLVGKLKEFGRTYELTNEEFDRRATLRSKLYVHLVVGILWAGLALVETLKLLSRLAIYP